MEKARTIPYNWGANYVRLDQVDIEIVLPRFVLVLCVRDMKRTVGYRDVDDTFISFVDYAAMVARGDRPDVVPVAERRCVFSLDMWHGPSAPWLHQGDGQYFGYYRMPEISPRFWHSGDRFDVGGFFLVFLSKPNTIEAMDYDIVLPGLYLAQSEQGSPQNNWKIHHPGFRYRSTGEFSVRPRSSRVPSFAVDFWLKLPNPGIVHAVS